jgi:hypothetical protein
MPTSLHIKFASLARLGVGQFLRATENWAKFMILRDGTLRLSVKEGQHLDARETRMEKEHQGDAFELVKYVTVQAQVHKHNCKECVCVCGGGGVVMTTEPLRCKLLLDAFQLVGISSRNAMAERRGVF